MPTGAQKIAETLIEAGVDHVFGIPGGATAAVHNAFFDNQDKSKFSLTRHDQQATHLPRVQGRRSADTAAPQELSIRIRRLHCWHVKCNAMPCHAQHSFLQSAITTGGS